MFWLVKSNECSLKQITLHHFNNNFQWMGIVILLWKITNFVYIQIGWKHGLRTNNGGLQEVQSWKVQYKYIKAKKKFLDLQFYNLWNLSYDMQASWYKYYVDKSEILSNQHFHLPKSMQSLIFLKNEKVLEKMRFLKLIQGVKIHNSAIQMMFVFDSVYCPKGYKILSAANETCQPCSRGSYKDNSDVFGSCVSCPTGNTTEKMNSTSIDSCSISKYF